MSRSSLRHIGGSGRRIIPSESTLKTVLDYVTAHDYPTSPWGYSDGNVDVARNVQRNKKRWYQCVATEDVDQYAVLEIKDSYLDFRGDQILVVSKPTDDAVDFAANEDYELKRDRHSWVRIIAPGQYCTVRCLPADEESLEYRDRVGPDSDRVTRRFIGDMVVAARRDPAPDSRDRVLVTLDPVWTWEGICAEEGGIPMNETGQVWADRETDEKYDVAASYGDVDFEDDVFVAWSANHDRWVAIQRPCPSILS